MPQQAHIFKNPDQGFLENMVSVHTLTLLAILTILRIVGGEGGRQSPLPLPQTTVEKGEYEKMSGDRKDGINRII